MNARDELIKDLAPALADPDGLDDATQDATERLNPYAIGRWVPVSERLPEFKRHYWSGYMIEDGITKHGIRSKQNFKLGDITHWLELDIPEVSQ